VEGHVPRRSYRAGWQRLAFRLAVGAGVAEGGYLIGRNPDTSWQSAQGLWEHPDAALATLQTSGIGAASVAAAGGLAYGLLTRERRELMREWVGPLHQALAWWRASAILRFGQQMVGGLLQRCRAAGKAIRERVRPLVDTALAAVDVAAVVFTVRGTFARRHVLAEARRHLGETLRGRAFEPGLDDDIADQALARHGRQRASGRPSRSGAGPADLHR
jgi:hypothetical protein